MQKVIAACPKGKLEFMFFFFTLLRHIIVMNKVMENHSWTFVYNAKCINTGTCASYTTTAKLYLFFSWLLSFHSSDVFIYF